MDTIEAVFESYGATRSTKKLAGAVWNWTHDDLVNYTDWAGWFSAALKDNAIAVERESTEPWESVTVSSYVFPDEIEAAAAWELVLTKVKPGPTSKRGSRTPDAWQQLAQLAQLAAS